MATRRRFLTMSAAALAAPALPRMAVSQTYPSRQIRAMVPFAPGSSLDIVGRIVMDPLSRQLGQTIVIENRGGAGGTIGTAAVVSAEPDGHTLLIQASAHSAAPAAYPKLGYDPVRDFSGVIPFGTIPNVTVVHPSRGFKTVNDLVAAAKKSGQFTYGSAGVGSATHWAAERLRIAGGYDATHVPFKGGPEALTEVMAGRLDFSCMGISAALPDVPTTLEAGLKDSDYNYWLGLFVPAKTPRAIIERLHAETEKALAQPAVQDKFKPQGIEPLKMTPAQFDDMIKREVATNIALANAAKLKFN